MSTTANRISNVPLSSPSIAQEDIDAVVSVLQTPTLSIGPKVQAFEQAVAERFGTSHAVAVNSGTSGLHICLDAFDIGDGDEVITSPFSFVASANCILYGGGRPVFVDIDETTLAIDPAKLEHAITGATRAIIPVDVFGQPCPIDEYHAITKSRQIRIIQDSCEAIGATRNGKYVGSSDYCDAAVFAFYPNKQMTTGEGGIVVTSDEDAYRVMSSLRNQGRDDEGTWMNHVRLGYNYRLDEMSAALGLSQFQRLDDILEKRHAVAQSYAERLSDVPGIQIPQVLPETTRMSWFVYVIRLDPTIDRTQVMNKLQAKGVPSRPYFVPIHLQPYYRERFGYKEGDFPVTERVASSTLAIPFFTDMSEDQIDYVCEAITDTVTTRGES